MLDSEAVRFDFESAVSLRGLRRAEVARSARAVALFGSRAVEGCARATSDWDVLLVSSGRSRMIGNIDLVWIDHRDMHTRAWLGGDLAGHIAEYGCWFQGECHWRHHALDFIEAARRKEARLVRLMRAADRAWNLLGEPYRTKHAALLRREVQRRRLLLECVRIPL